MKSSGRKHNGSENFAYVSMKVYINRYKINSDSEYLLSSAV